ncbi:MAG TPA: hypothetical protein DCP91_04880 [Eggerthellaceae bacterium]|nr:hypothetical protein [Eggerthellaceae bacterium]
MRLPISYFFCLIAMKEPNARLLDEHAQPLSVQWLATVSSDTVARGGFLYFLDEGIGLEQKEDVSFGCVVYETASGDYPGIPRIVVPRNCDMHELMDHTITNVDRYRMWEDSLHETLVGNISLQSMLDITYDFIPRPMYIADPCWRMVARIDADMEEMSGIWHHQLQHGGYLPIETINALNDSGEYELITNSNRAFIVDTKAFVIGFIAKAIKFRGKLLGYFFIVDLWHDLTLCDVEVANRFGNTLAAALGSRGGAIDDAEVYHEGLVSAMLDTDHIEEGMVSNLIATTTGWKLIGDYRIVVMKHARKDFDNAMMRMRAVGVITSGYDCYTEPYKDMTVVIFANAELDYDDFKRHLRSCVEKLQISLFVSGRFTSFLDFPSQFSCLCDLVDCHEPVFRQEDSQVVYSDNLFPRRLAQACDHRLPTDFETQLLRDFDASHGTEYAKSLYTFLLHERNYVTSSASLYLHRNTLRNRIEKINEMLDVDLDDPIVRLRLIVSLNTALNAQS